MNSRLRRQMLICPSLCEENLSKQNSAAQACSPCLQDDGEAGLRLDQFGIGACCAFFHLHLRYPAKLQ
jgi:hypothetical protein